MTPRIGVKGEERLEDRNEESRGGIAEIEEGVARPRITPVPIKDARAVNSAKDKFPRRYISIPEFFPSSPLPTPSPRLPSSRSSLSPRVSSFSEHQRRGLRSLPLYTRKADVASFLPPSSLCSATHPLPFRLSLGSLPTRLRRYLLTCETCQIF